MSQKIKRILFVDDLTLHSYLIRPLKSKFDEILELSSFMITLDEYSSNKKLYKGRLPSLTYDPLITSAASPPLTTQIIDKKVYVKIKDFIPVPDAAYFVVGKFCWYFLRDLSGLHVGLRNTNLDWQVPHLNPFSMGTNKYVFSHYSTDEFYENNLTYFFDDEKLLKTVPPLPQSKVLTTIDEIETSLLSFTNKPVGTRFGMDYETNGLWKKDKYEKLKAIGVGISSTLEGVYIELRYLNETDLEKFKFLYKAFLDKHYKDIWVFNLDFEMIVTRKLLGPWCTYEFKDADVWRIIYGDQVGYSKKLKVVKNRYETGSEISMEKVTRDQRWSLKYTAQKFLSVPSWDNDFERLESLLREIFYGYKLSTIEEFITNPLLSKEVHRIASVIKDPLITRVLKKLCYYKKLSSKSDIEDAFSIVPSKLSLTYDSSLFTKALLGTKIPKEVYNHPNWKIIESEYPDYIDEFKFFIEHPEYEGNPFAVQPADIMGKYCILDSYYTLMISEKELEKDEFTPKTEEQKNRTGADWITTSKLVDIFNSNKALGSKLNMYGLFKSNKKRHEYNDIQEKVRVYCNYILAKGWHTIKTSGVNLTPHPNEKLLNTVSLSCIKRGLDPTDFTKITKSLFKEVYDTSQPLKWNDTIAESLFGISLADSLKDVFIEHHPKGFVNPDAFSRASNLHKECSSFIEDEWKQLKLPKSFDWKLCLTYYEESKHIKGSLDTLKELDSFNIKGVSLDEILKLDKVEYTNSYGQVISLTMSEAITELKEKFYDVYTASETDLGFWFEKWKDFRVLFAMYSEEYSIKIINDLSIFNKEDSLEDKVSKFKSFVVGVIGQYRQPYFKTWLDAKNYSIKNGFPPELSSPKEEDLKDPLQEKAFIQNVISRDLYSKFGLTKKFLDEYYFFSTTTPEDIKKDKESLLKYKDLSPLSYRDSSLEKGRICKIFDSLLPSGEETSQELVLKGDISPKVDYNYYPILTTLFKLYRKYDKLGQYLNGQLVDSDYKVLSIDEDGVPKIDKLTNEEKYSRTLPDDYVKMFPSYEIMQKITKRNSSGIHTVPSSSEVKGVISAPDDSLLVYTDISSMELRGISTISNDKVMIQYFESGKDIYTEASMAYHVGYLKKNMTYEEVKVKYRSKYKIGVISTIYTATDPTLANSFGVQTYEVREIKNAIFSKFTTLYDWQQKQVEYNKANQGFIKTYLGDRRKTYDPPKKQGRQAVNMDVQGTCSLVATAGFDNIISSARHKKQVLTPAVIVHDAVVAYAKAKDLEQLYDHYQESFYDFLDENYKFRFPFDLEVATNYFEKTILKKGSSPREFSISGSNRAIYEVLSRAVKYGKQIEFIGTGITLETVKQLIDDNYSIMDQYVKTEGKPSFNRDFSKGFYSFKFID